MNHLEPNLDNLTKSLTRSLQSETRGEKVAGILNAALSAVDPFSAVKKGLSSLSNDIGGELGDLKISDFRNLKLVGAGKAGQPMAAAALEFFGNRISEGNLIVKDGYAKKPFSSPKIKIHKAGHPLPDQRGVNATQEIIAQLQDCTERDLVICLISGGGSALLVSPVPNISLKELQELTDLLLASGATINEINKLRKHLDQVKGGQLARIAAPASVLSLILSDVVGDPLDVIASGPTIPDPTTYQDALDIMARYSLQDQVPGSIRTYLERGHKGEFPETPKPGERFFSKVKNLVIGSNHTATESATAHASEVGFNALTLTNFMQGEARQAGKFVGALVRQMAVHDQPLQRPACIILGGETTVTLRGSGKGGRNQELALAAVDDLAGLNDVALITLATDGGDGPTDAAGAVVTGSTKGKAAALELEAGRFLDHNDAYHFFAPLEDLLKIGPTQTNVNDLTFLFAF